MGRIRILGPDRDVGQSALMTVKIDLSVSFLFDNDKLRGIEPGAASSRMGSEGPGCSGGCDGDRINKTSGEGEGEEVDDEEEFGYQYYYEQMFEHMFGGGHKDTESFQRNLNAPKRQPYRYAGQWREGELWMRRVVKSCFAKKLLRMNRVSRM